MTEELALPRTDGNPPTAAAEIAGPSPVPKRARRRNGGGNTQDVITLRGGRVVNVHDLQHGEQVHEGSFLDITVLVNKKGKRRFMVEGVLPDKLREPGNPKRHRVRKKTFVEAHTYVLGKELAARGLPVEKELKATDLTVPWLRAFERAHERLNPFNKGPEIVAEAVDFFLAHRSPRNKDISLLALLEELVEAKGTDKPDAAVEGDEAVVVCANGRKKEKVKKKKKRKRSRRTVAGWRAGVYAFTRLHGKPTGRKNRFNRDIYDIPAADVTEERLRALDDIYDSDTAQCYINRISAVLQYGVDKGYLEKNFASKVVLEEDLNEDEANQFVAVLTNDSVQRGLNMAARIFGGKMLPHFVLMVGGGLRPIAEMPFFAWTRVDWRAGGVQVYSSKTGETRIVELAANWMAILRWAYDKGIQPEFSVSAWGAIKMFMNYWDEKCPKSLWPEGFEDYDSWIADMCRHTACSNRQRYCPDLKENSRWAGNSIEVFSKHYSNGLITLEMAAQFYSLLPDLMPRTPETVAEIGEDLLKHSLIGPGDDLPPLPIVPKILLRCPKAITMPTIPDRELEKMIWDTSMQEIANKLGLDRVWLAGYCRAKRIKVPGQCNKRGTRPKLEDVPTPPPFITISHEELRDLIWKRMSVAAVAHELGVYPTWLRIYCLVWKIDYPDRKRFARQKGIAAAQRTFQGPTEEVQRVLENMTYQDAAKHFEIRVDTLLRYCRKNDIDVPGYKFFRRQGQYDLKLEAANQAPQSASCSETGEANLSAVK